MMESAEKKEIGRRTTMEDRTLLDFLAQAEKLKCNTRHSGLHQTGMRVWRSTAGGSF